MNTNEFPLSITEKGVSAVIRKTEKIKAGQNHTYFIVEYILKGRRKQVWRSDLGAAKDVARDACIAIGNGGAATLELSDRERLAYLRAKEILAALGVPLDVAASDYAAAIKALPPGTTLKEAVDFFRTRNPAALEKRTVSQVADEMLAVKQAAKLSDAHLKDLESRLNRISDDFQMNIAAVSGVMIQTWLDKLAVKGRTKQNYLRVMGALFGFAIRRKYLPKDAADEIEAVQSPKEDNEEVEIFTPAEMREVLAAARPEMVPFLAIGAFAGLRSAEIVRLDWQEIKAAKAKTGARRLVPVTGNLAQWLTPYVKKSGPVVTFDSWWNQIPKVADAVNKRRGEAAPAFSWKHNALRHSFCSYRIAGIKNAAQVALEAGNSPQMIFRHYRQLVNEKQAADWFSVLPPAKKTGRTLALPETVKAV
jgi:integrase